jgi:hypothetical protein
VIITLPLHSAKRGGWYPYRVSLTLYITSYRRKPKTHEMRENPASPHEYKKNDLGFNQTIHKPREHLRLVPSNVKRRTRRRTCMSGQPVRARNVFHHAATLSSAETSNQFGTTTTDTAAVHIRRYTHTPITHHHCPTRAPRLTHLENGCWL